VAAIDLYTPYGGLAVEAPANSSSLEVFSNPPEPETQVEEAVDPRLVGAALLNSIRLAQEEAELAMEKAEQLGPPLTEDEILPIK
jgi:hypothetical protein